MWKEYSVSYIKKNKAASISIMVAAFVAALFISAICSLFYNLWIDDVRRLIDKEGDWQARFITEISENNMKSIENHSNVKAVAVSQNEEVVNIYFENLSTIYKDMPEIAKMLNMDESDIEYHNTLLVKYFIFSEEEKKDPPLLLAFYVCILILVCISLILIIRSAFQFSMNARIYQLGILQSIGATPNQLRIVLLQEAFLLSVIPVVCGMIFGIGLCIGFLRYANTIMSQRGLREAIFEYHYLLFIITMLCSFVTIFLSAWFPARKLSKITPLQAIKGEYEVSAERIRKFRLTSAIWGIEGELSRKSLYTRRKALRTATICLTVSFFVLTVFLNFITLSEISTKHTYFERYKNSWDVMIEVQNPDINDTDLLKSMQNINGISACTAYEKNTAYVVIDEESMSDEVNSVGGYSILNTSYTQLQEKTYLIEAPMIVLDEESYTRYCDSIGIRDSGSDKSSVILVNTIWDSKNSDFKNREYIPFLKENAECTLKLFSDKETDNAFGEVTVAAYTDKAPNLREEYSHYSLIQIISQNTYQTFAPKLPATEKTLYINLCASSAEQIEGVAKQAESVIGNKYEYTIENRLEEEKINAEIYSGYKKIMSAICGLLACIGIANVFANTLGYIYQRKREFARYQSLGVTPKGIAKILCAEALIIGVKPILISIPFNILFVIFAVNKSGINMKEFLSHMPIIPMFIFSCAVLASVGISYFIGSIRMKDHNIIEDLKNDILF